MLEGLDEIQKATQIIIFTFQSGKTLTTWLIVSTVLMLHIMFNCGCWDVKVKFIVPSMLALSGYSFLCEEILDIVAV